MPPFGGIRGNVHGSSMARWKARGRLPPVKVQLALIGSRQRAFQRAIDEPS